MGESRSMLVCHGRPWDGRAISNDAATMAGRGERVSAPMAGRTRFARPGIVVGVWTWDADSIPDRGTRLAVHEERSRGWVIRESMLVCHGRPWDGRAHQQQRRRHHGRPWGAGTALHRWRVAPASHGQELWCVCGRGTRTQFLTVAHAWRVHEERSRGWVIRDRCSCATVGHGMGVPSATTPPPWPAVGSGSGRCTDGGSHPLRTARNCGGRVDVGRGLNS